MAYARPNLDPGLMDKDLDLLFQALNERLTDEQQDLALRLEGKLRWRPLCDSERAKLQELVDALYG